MEGAADAESTMLGVCRALNVMDWLGVCAGSGARPVGRGVRLVGVDMGAPDDLGRDGGGRWVRSVDAICTVVRDVGEDVGDDD